MVLTALGAAVTNELRVAMQTSLFGSLPLRCAALVAPWQALDRSSSLLFQPAWVQGSDLVFERLRDEMPWQAMQRPMYDRIVEVPRLICTVDPSAVEPSDPLRVVWLALEAALGTRFAQAGLNYYRSGEDSVAWHRDRIGRRHIASSTVALVSFGSPRTFALRRYSPTHPPTTTLPAAPPPTPVAVARSARAQARTHHRWQLGHGDLIVMTGASQRDWEHCVPKESGVGPRISVAFRSSADAEGPPN